MPVIFLYFELPATLLKHDFTMKMQKYADMQDHCILEQLQNVDSKNINQKISSLNWSVLADYSQKEVT